MPMVWVRVLRRRVRPESLWLLASFLVTFLVARVVVFYIMYHDAPELYVRVGGAHVHHHVWGILLLAGLGLYLILDRGRTLRPRTAAMAYGVGLALTLDEFGMWLHMGGSYWQRASYDAVVIGGLILAVAAVWPTLRLVRRRASAPWQVALAACGVVAIVLVLHSYRFGGRMLSEVRELVEPTLATSDDPRRPTMTATD